MNFPNDIPNIKTFGELKESGYRYRSIKEEMAQNLAEKLAKKQPIFPQIHGYDDTVLPQLYHAILAGHNIVLLGEKGQAKTKIMRSLVELLDPYFPIIEGTPIPESPYRPITKMAKKLIEEKKENTPIRWLHRSERYGEKIAPGSRISDIIGDIDPAKIIHGTSMGTEEALHYGLLPRMNHGIFAINELPDLDYLVQVAMFNILEEEDIQIRGLPIRLPLDVCICFTANPSEYTRSGKIITQLKDRIGAEIRTHYPKSREIGLQITKQEIQIPNIKPDVIVPKFIEEIIEEITIQARRHPLINQKSGVSARLSIANYETIVASARRRALLLNQSIGYARMTDFGNIFSSSLGKIELDPYRDEAVTEFQVIMKLIDLAIKEVFEEYFPEKKYHTELENIVKQIYEAEVVEISDSMPSSEYKKFLKIIPSLFDLLRDQNWNQNDELMASGIEFIFEGLTTKEKISRRRLGEVVSFKSVDLY
ncbi:MAG: hypothetical protein NZ853_05160 [Leptospiraceae bacterium]|nr:hypothetical protein [Leptospiraceae bacterium]MDW7976664.1 hypothetical protein [Leptospiraceae bacterium]